MIRPSKRAYSMSCAARHGPAIYPGRASQNGFLGLLGIDLFSDVPIASEIIEQIIEQAASTLAQGARLIRGVCSAVGLRETAP
jgi:hypothetical protein